MLPQSPDEDEDDSSSSHVPIALQNLTPSRPHHLHGLSIRMKTSGNLQESHKEPIWCVSWSKGFSQSTTEAQNQCVSRYLATCGSRYATVYRIVFDSNHSRRVDSKHFVMTQSHVTEDQEESFYACTFAGRSGGDSIATMSNKRMPELLCVGGKRRLIHVIDLAAKKTVMTLHGHGDAILSLKPCPIDEWILLSSSEDESIRLWNLRSGAPVAVLKGREGHMDSVVSAAWNPAASLIVSSGMDTTIKIWDAREGSEIERAIIRSHELIDVFKREGTIIHEKPYLVEKPIYSTQKVHANCIDCVQFIQNGLVLSKSVDSRIELWEPKIEGEPDSESLRMKNQGIVEHFHSFEYKNGDSWFMNFATDPLFQRLVVGDNNGFVYVWLIGQKSSSPVHVLPTHGNIKVSVRGLSFSPCGNTLVAFRDDGSLMKWDLSV